MDGFTKMNKKVLSIIIVFMCGLTVGAILFSQNLVPKTAPVIGAAPGVLEVKAFLYLEGIPGESDDAVHRQEILLEAFNWSEAYSNTAASGGRTGVAAINDFCLQMECSIASPKLIQYCTTGISIKSAVLSVQRTTEGGSAVDFLVWKFQNVIISSYKTQFNVKADTRVIDEITIFFNSFSMEYRQMNPDGTYREPTRFAWNVAQEKPS